MPFDSTIRFNPARAGPQSGRASAPRTARCSTRGFTDTESGKPAPQPLQRRYSLIQEARYNRRAEPLHVRRRRVRQHRDRLAVREAGGRRTGMRGGRGGGATHLDEAAPVEQIL